MVLVIGDLNVDVVARTSAWPRPGGESEAPWAEIRRGGAGGNVAAWLAWLGIEVRIFARIGDDPWGEFIVRELARLGIRTGFVQRDPAERTGVVLSLIDPTGERAMITCPGANAALEADGLEGAMRGADCLYLSGYVARRCPGVARHALGRARALGVPVCLDLNPLFTAGDLCTFGPEGIALVFGTERELAGPGKVREAFVKRGPRGCIWRRGRRELEIPGFTATVRDTTGAGDAFVAGAIAARLRGYGPRLQGLVGNLCGALSTMGHRPPQVPLEAAEALVEGADLTREERLAIGAFLEERKRRDDGVKDPVP